MRVQQICLDIAVAPERRCYLLQLLVHHPKVRMHHDRLTGKRFLLRPDNLHAYLHLIRIPYIILVRKRIVVRSAALLQQALERTAGTDILRVLQNSDPLVLGGIGIEYLFGAVLRTVITDEQAPVGVGLRDDRFDLLRQIPLAVICGHQDMKHTHFSLLFSCCI